MSNPKRHAAFLAYLLPVIGWLYVFIFHRDDEFAVYHAKQAIMLTIFVIALPVLWAVISWILLWIPTAGALIAASTFTLVAIVFGFGFALWIVGLANAARARLEPLPVVGRYALRYLG